jgi:hypothetical protein
LRPSLDWIEPLYQRISFPMETLLEKQLVLTVGGVIRRFLHSNPDKFAAVQPMFDGLLKVMRATQIVSDKIILIRALGNTASDYIIDDIIPALESFDEHRIQMAAISALDKVLKDATSKSSIDKTKAALLETYFDRLNTLEVRMQVVKVLLHSNPQVLSGEDIEFLVDSLTIEAQWEAGEYLISSLRTASQREVNVASHLRRLHDNSTSIWTHDIQIPRDQYFLQLQSRKRDIINELLGDVSVVRIFFTSKD